MIDSYFDSCKELSLILMRNFHLSFCLILSSLESLVSQIFFQKHIFRNEKRVLLERLSACLGQNFEKKIDFENFQHFRQFVEKFILENFLAKLTHAFKWVLN